MAPSALHPFCPTCRAIFRERLPRCPADGTEIELRTEDPLVGASLGARYRLEELIGRGATGRVYRARLQGLKSAVAVKILYGEFAAEPRRSERFLREAASTSRFRHPNIIHLLDFDRTESGLPFLVMEHLEGRSLSQLIQEAGPLPAERTARLLADLCRALAYLHGCGFIHRDLKGANVMITRDRGEEMAQLFDFGIALERELEPAHRLTTDRTAIGTVAYMAPEQALTGKIDHRADLFALGVILYEMLAGRQPFEGTPTLIALKNATSQIPPVEERTPGVEADPLLEAVARKLMEKKPGDRFQSAEDVLDVIRRTRS